jgi:hypothetical protein
VKAGGRGPGEDASALCKVFATREPDDRLVTLKSPLTDNVVKSPSVILAQHTVEDEPQLYEIEL